MHSQHVQADLPERTSYLQLPDKISAEENQYLVATMEIYYVSHYGLMAKTCEWLESVITIDWCADELKG